eukprot:gnl/TRDRNA2_/TRDRNA2_174320_c2_seq9.p1 gnl/TRDRNA2_/TRDRNA2_174320_c2~~gnl/TRDRNA2_/TRDRNA2_174320_c2_seq9.p1  ORF type:complete len:198 (+),score=31.23 gnl/TRDRNA2_/TRDRNA2_174320_c2_seq9:36-596(+)
MFDVKYHNHDFVLQFVTSYKAANGIVEVPGVRKRVSEELLDAFKDMQRNDYNFKAAWEEHIGPDGKRDPRVHTEEELMKFMADYKVSGKNAAPVPDTSEDSIRGQLKLLQREDSRAKELWGVYCETHGDGQRDPGGHPEEFVEKFMDAYKGGNLKSLGINLSSSKSYGKGKGAGKGKAWDPWWGPY